MGKVYKNCTATCLFKTTRLIIFQKCTLAMIIAAPVLLETQEYDSLTYKLSFGKKICHFVSLKILVRGFGRFRGLSAIDVISPSTPYFEENTENWNANFRAKIFFQFDRSIKIHFQI